MSFSATEGICTTKDPVTWTGEKSKMFVESCREMAEFHYQNCPPLAHIYDRYQFDPRSIRSEEDLLRIPPISVHAMKYHLLLSKTQEQAVLKMTSSGTSGQKTQVWMDQPSLDRAQAMVRSLWQEEGLISDEPTNYIMFVYDPDQANDLGIAFSAKNRLQFAPVKNVEYMVKMVDGQWRFQKERVFELLESFSKDGAPVRLLGITAFIFEMVDEIEKRGLDVRLPKGSFMFTTGGWKAAESKKVSREEFQKRAADAFGIVHSNIRDGYGMAEHGAPYWQCHEHELHVPAYCRVIARDPVSMKQVPDGTPGVLQLLTPFNSMMPTTAILTTDMGVVSSAKCPCGKNSPTFKILGRAGLAKHKGCAIHASEIVKRG